MAARFLAAVRVLRSIFRNRPRPAAIDPTLPARLRRAASPTDPRRAAA